MFRSSKQHQQQAALDLMEQLVVHLEAARGRNAFRGQVVRKPRQLQLLVELAGRQGTAPVQYLSVRIMPHSDDPDDRPDAVFRYAGQRYLLSEADDMAAFVAQITHIARGGREYIRTALKNTTYK